MYSMWLLQKKRKMRYIFTLLLTGFISFNVLANPETPPDDKTPELAQKTSSQESPDGTEESTINFLESHPGEQHPLFEVEEQKTDNNSTETLILLTKKEQVEEPKNTSQTESTKNLDETRVGRAIIEGDIEAYKEALNELKEFNTPLSEILQKSTSDRKKIFDLLIEVKKNKDFFANELVNLFVLKMQILHSQSVSPVSSNSNLIAETQAILEKAKQENNESVVLMFTQLENLFTQYDKDFKTIKEQYGEELIKLQKEQETVKVLYEEKIKELTENQEKELAEAVQKEQETVKALYEDKIKELIKQHQETSITMRKQLINLIKKHKPRFFTNTAVFLSGGGLSAWFGYDWFSSQAANVVSPQITEFFSIVSDKEIGAAAMALGAVLTTKGLFKCYKSFRQGREIKEHQKQLNDAVKDRQQPSEKHGGRADRDM